MINLELEEDEALALAQFVKRLGWGEIRLNAVDEKEAYVMRHSISKLQDALKEEGYSPR